MRQANEHSVCEAETVEELARRGRAYASVKLCQCEDGLYRYALAMAYSYGGFCGPIYVKATGFTSPSAAKEAATQEMLRRFPKPWASEPQSVHDELRDLKAMIEATFRQPSLF